MPSLSDKLKSLGVKVGAGNLPAASPRDPSPGIDRILGGHPYPTSMGDAYIVEKYYPPGARHGRAPLNLTSPLSALSVWANDSRLSHMPPQAFAFLDTETTGLQGGTGTFAFLIGVARFEGDEFHLAQFFMRDPTEEPAQLAALEEFLAPCQVLVTYNGKAFDIPLLVSRYTSHGWAAPFNGYAHVDLLHLSRRLWQYRLPSRTLSNVETQILGSPRTEQDVPGWMIPQMYFDYLRSGDPSPLRSVLYHNAMDVVALAALLNHTANLLADPISEEIEHAVDILSIARIYEDLGDLDSAIRSYLHGLSHMDVQEQRVPQEVYLAALQRLAAIYKRRGEYPNAVNIWREAARQQHIESHVELAKYFEHQRRDYQEALSWTQSAIELVKNPGVTTVLRSIYLPELEHRLERLLRKLEKSRSE